MNQKQITKGWKRTRQPPIVLRRQEIIRKSMGVGRGGRIIRNSETKIEKQTPYMKQKEAERMLKYIDKR